MLPLYDSIPAKSRAHVNWLLIIVNMMIAVAVFNLSPEDKSNAFQHVGFIPANLFSTPLTPITIITSLFFHDNFFHFLGNAIFLWVFGKNIEGLMGSWRYLVFYILGGVVAAFFHIITHVHSPIPVIGASGSIAAVMGAYYLYFPHSKIYTLIPFRVVPLPAPYFLAVMFALQIVPGIQDIATVSSSNFSTTAWWTHIGGLVFGYWAARYFSRGRKPPKINKEKNTPQSLSDIFEMMGGKNNS